jgi:hypothetical protein
MKLNLGVVEVSYSGKGSISTGEVAEILEDEYSVMGNFVALHMPEIEESVEVSFSEAIESLMAGAPSTIDPLGDAVQDIQALFGDYLDNEEIAQTGQEGVPTQAALDGVRTSLKNKKELNGRSKSKIRGTRRPSFIDTGLYRNSFRVWAD